MTDDIKNLDETETANIDDRSEPIRKRVEKITGSTSETFPNLADDADDTADTNIDEKKTVKYSEMVKKLEEVNEAAFVNVVLFAVCALALGLMFGMTYESEKSYLNYKVIVEVNNVNTINLTKFRDNSFQIHTSYPHHLKNMVIKKEDQKLVLTAIYRGNIDVSHMRLVMHKVRDALKNEAKSITCYVADYKTGAHVTSKL